MNNNNPYVICFGEVLWDILPNGKVPGGAPMNVAYHLNQLGIKADMISKVGKDDLGKELLQFMQSKGIGTQYVHIDDLLKTGMVKIILDNPLEVKYVIEYPVAWDKIEVHFFNEINTATHLVYGSLACRDEISRKTLFQLFDKIEYKIFDVNLRAPHFEKEVLEVLLNTANLVKMNVEELDCINSWYNNQTEPADKMQFLRNRFSLDKICVTNGAKGAMFLSDDGFLESEGTPIKVADTVGSGDAFLAALVSKLLKNASIKETLNFAGKLGAFVATKSGAVPAYQLKDLNELET